MALWEYKRIIIIIITIVIIIFITVSISIVKKANNIRRKSSGVDY